MDNPDPPVFFDTLFEEELKLIRNRRDALPTGQLRSFVAVRAQALHRRAPAATAEHNWMQSCAEFDRNRLALRTNPPQENLVGLALSGGGIRSATFCLGFLQALEKSRLLPMFDYLSTVSGGGFVGGCWSAWLTRPKEISVGLGPFMLPPGLDLTKTPCLRFDPQTRRLYCRGQMPPEVRQTLIAAFQQEVKKSDAPRGLNMLCTAAQAALGLVTMFCDRTLSEIPPRHNGRLFPPPERIEPERAPYYFNPVRPNRSVAESGLSAGDDPLHHLRLFSNYLTPRRGFLSTDAWRAAVVVLRSLVMNWMIILPILFTVVALPRIYFASEPDWTNLFRSKVRVSEAKHAGYALIVDLKKIQSKLGTSPGQKPSSEQLAEAEPWEEDYLAVLKGRALFASIPLGTILSWLIVLSIAWMTCVRERRTTRDWIMGLGTFTAGFALVGCFIWFGGMQHKQVIAWWYWGALPVFPSFIMVAWAVWPLFDRRSPDQLRNEVRQNRLVRMQTGLLIIFAVIFLALLASGFAYELFIYFWTVYSGPYIRAAGWLTILGTIGTAAYTAWKAAPAGGGDPRQSGLQNARTTQLVFAVAPLLFWVLMIVIGETLVHNFLQYVDDQAMSPERPAQVSSVANHRPLPPLFKLTAAAGVGLLLCLLLSASEMRWSQDDRRKHPVRLVIASLIVCSACLAYAAVVGRRFHNWTQYPWVAGSVTVGAGLLIGIRSLRDWAEKDPVSGSVFRRSIARLAQRRSKQFGQVLAAACIAIALTAVYCGMSGLPGVRLPNHWADYSGFNAVLSITPWLGSFLCVIVLNFEVKFGDGSNQRTVGLLAAIWVLLALMLGIGLYHQQAFGDPYNDRPPENLPVLHIYALIDLIAVSLSCVVAIGWTADPNAVSLHDFYKYRLVRAYLGASNPRRSTGNSEITDSVEGDDVLLRDLDNCARGGPYPLVNVTLNLVASKDLSTAQRSSAHFLFSKLFCGSLRTGFRSTSDYMGGRLSLGTAIAVSGAAASPNMGAKTPNAVFAALLALLNVRLGYWAPTPHRSRWRSPQARLWPFYTMREFLSQTNDLSSYCYLTDGGHFDNTGLYSLVQRGCRNVLVVDCGADPAPPAFHDLGDALRRCRIDFGAEIKLNLDPLVPAGTKSPGATDKDPGKVGGAALRLDAGGRQTPSGRPIALGTITYSFEHVSRLGWKNCDRPESRRGLILWVKPSLIASASGDVHQYGFSHVDFPQQSTADQWFDEAQFESYRRLGEQTAHAVFEQTKVFQEVERDTNDAVFTPAEADWLFGELHQDR